MSASSDDEDALIASLEATSENDPTLSALREKRIQALSSALSHQKSLRTEGFGTYCRITTEKSLLEITTSPTYDKCIVHFYKDDFNRCRIMDGHLGKLAEKHLEARFLRVEVEDAPFLVGRLGVRVLPCVIGFVGGVSAERVVGFEGLGGGDDFRTEVLEEKFVDVGVLERKTEVEGLGMGSGGHGERKQSGRNVGGDEDDDDWD
ncbi:uncharacterized protein KY384_003635 [Bacidia gigantensis]|uniref:uncharacterized protein n=1 Tax=Bacidia gigantensis TaxID=2732470 RepID=UPI001D0487AB|nr:uncharacterized protein KY384_003635 [Bacidia gigantensis]KAG8531999.1 hypothetical protein KY384_003635 [Bacidia gigantensis]